MKTNFIFFMSYAIYKDKLIETSPPLHQVFRQSKTRSLIFVFLSIVLGDKSYEISTPFNQSCIDLYIREI